MKLIPPEVCLKRFKKGLVVCKEKGRRMEFHLRSRSVSVVRVTVDRCDSLRASLDDPVCKLCDFLVTTASGEEHYVELKGRNVEHGLRQLESTIPRLSSLYPNERVSCWLITTESPSAQSKFQVLKAKFEKRINARLVIRTNQAKHDL